MLFRSALERVWESSTPPLHMLGLPVEPLAPGRPLFLCSLFGLPVELTLRKPHFLSPNLLFLLPVLPADPMRVPGRAFLFPVFPSSSRGPRLSILDFHLIPRSPAGAWKSFPLLVFSLRRRGFLLEDRKNYGFGTSCVSHASKRFRLVLWQELRCMTLQRRRVCLPRRSPSPSGIPTK